MPPSTRMFCPRGDDAIVDLFALLAKQVAAAVKRSNR
jgi:hypothetical protein